VLLVSAGLSPPAKRAHERQATYIVAAFIAGAARQPQPDLRTTGSGQADLWPAQPEVAATRPRTA
jgi:hypothetical protein